MFAKLSKEGSVVEVPWTMCAKLVGFLWDQAAHNFDLPFLTWLVSRDHRVRTGGVSRHEYQAVDPWTRQSFHEVISTLEDTSDFLLKVLLSREDLQWMKNKLWDHARNTGGMFTGAEAVILLSKWMAEYAAYVQTV